MVSIKFLNAKSINATTNAMINEETITIIALSCSSFQEGQVTLKISSL